MKALNKDELFRIIKFGLVGGLNTLVDRGIFALLVGLAGLHFVPAKCISYAAGLLNSYALNSRWTFKKDGERSPRVIVKFVIVNFIALGVNLGAIALLKAMGMRSEILADCFAIPLSLAVNFLGNRLFVFK